MVAGASAVPSLHRTYASPSPRRTDTTAYARSPQYANKLESFGLVSRKSYPEVPPRVEYRLTTLGRSLARLAGLFSRWVEKNAANLLKAEQEAA